MNNRQTQRALSDYVNSATDLAELIKWCIQHNDMRLNNEVVLKLNKFAVAANVIRDMTDELNNEVRKYDN